MKLQEIEETAIKLSIAEARKSKNEDGKIVPFVGAVVIKEDKIIASAYRGEILKGEHAEFTLLEKKLTNVSLAGSTVFTTLEPCTSRNHPKLPCVERLIERKIKKVWIGMVDPNEKISGRGINKLHDVNIEVEMYPLEYNAEIRELNRAFIREQSKNSDSLYQRELTLLPQNIHNQNIAEPVLEQISAIDPLTIKNEILDAPPFQQKMIGYNYVGLNVIWRLKLFMVHHWEENIIHVNFEFKKNSYPTIHVEININDYPIFRVAKDYKEFEVSGKIIRCEAMHIYLEVRNIREL